jgi:hypothetical protein
MSADDFPTTVQLVLAALREQAKRKVAEQDWTFLAQLPEITKWLRTTADFLDDIVRRRRDETTKP